MIWNLYIQNDWFADKLEAESQQKHNISLFKSDRKTTLF
jgi:hypothetical protein